MRKVLVCLDKNYGASKTSATKHTALNPADLAEGAVGIYGIPVVSTNNADKFALITNGGSDAAGLVPDASFDGDRVFVNVGQASGSWSSVPLEPNGKVEYTSEAYAAAVAQVVTIPLTLAGTIVQNDESQVRISDQENLDQGGSIRSEFINSSIYAVPAETAYTLAIKHQTDLNGRLTKQWMSATVVSSTAGSDVAATTAVTNGSVTIVSNGHSVDAGDFVRIIDEIYVAEVITDVNTIELDRAYLGATDAAIATTAVQDLGAAPADVGLKLTSLVQGKNFSISVDGVIVDSVITITTGGTDGQGTGVRVNDAEREVRGYLGSTAGARDAVMPFPALRALPAGTYDVYVFTAKSEDNISTGGTARHAHNLYTELLVAFPDGGSNDGQGDFEAVLGEVLYGAADLGGLA